MVSRIAKGDGKERRKYRREQQQQQQQQQHHHHQTVGIGRDGDIRESGNTPMST